MRRHGEFPIVTFVGGGNMAAAMVSGLISNGYPAHSIGIVDPNVEQSGMLAKRFNVRTNLTIRTAVEQSQIVIIAVKPQAVAAVVAEMAQMPDIEAKLFVSIAAGIRLSLLEAALGPRTAIIRSMPNTPSLVGCGATAIFANAHTSQEQIAMATEMMESFGICVSVNSENQLDAVTAVSGSGPAYFFLLMEEIIRAGMQIGLSEQDAACLTLQTALGAAKMALEGKESPSQLRTRVTSPNGTTQCAIDSMKQDGIGELIERAIRSAHRRAVELGMPSGRED